MSDKTKVTTEDDPEVEIRKRRDLNTNKTGENLSKEEKIKTSDENSKIGGLIIGFMSLEIKILLI